MEGDRGGEGESLVAVDECVIASERVQKRRCLLVDAGVGIAAEDRGPRAGECRLEESVVADLGRMVEGAFGDAEEGRDW